MEGARHTRQGDCRKTDHGNGAASAAGASGYFCVLPTDSITVHSAISAHNGLFPEIRRRPAVHHLAPVANRGLARPWLELLGGEEALGVFGAIVDDVVIVISRPEREFARRYGPAQPRNMGFYPRTISASRARCRRPWQKRCAAEPRFDAYERHGRARPYGPSRIRRA